MESLPGWMFDPAVCLAVRVAAVPQTSRVELAALQALLRDATSTALQSPSFPEPISDAGHESCPQNRRISDAPAMPKPWEPTAECPPVDAEFHLQRDR